MKRLIIFMFILCLGIGASLYIEINSRVGDASNTTFNLPSKIQEVIPCVVKIMCDTPESTYYGYGGWQGSGVFIADDLILTAGHIVDGITGATIFTSDGAEYIAKSWYLEPAVDIGFIQVETPIVEGNLDFAFAILGEDVWAFGNPLGVFPVLTKGIISATTLPDDYSKTKDMVVTDTAINGGNSGCPLFNKNGKIVGICSWGYRGVQGMSYFVRGEILELCLKKYYAYGALKNAK